MEEIFKIQQALEPGEKILYVGRCSLVSNKLDWSQKICVLFMLVCGGSCLTFFGLGTLSITQGGLAPLAALALVLIPLSFILFILFAAVAVFRQLCHQPELLGEFHAVTNRRLLKLETAKVIEIGIRSDILKLQSSSNSHFTPVRR
jgi:hypothetical protein